MKTNLLQKQPSAMEFFERFPDEDSAREYLASGRWPHGVTCPRCGHHEVYTIRGGKLYSCKSCCEQFTVRTGTVMEDSKIPLRKWIYAMYLMTVSRKGISSVQLSKELGITQKSAWFMGHRIRAACKERGMISGTVEADETYIGGKEKNKHASKRTISGCGTVGKAIVFGMKNRSGETRAKVLPGVGSEDLHAAVKEAVATGSKLYTDNFRGYNGLTQQYQHHTVNHSAGEYVKGEAHTNTIESFWAIVKRAHYGTFHYWSRKHLARYIDEFVFKANINGLPAFNPKDITCGITAVRAYMAGMDGRRLTYKALIEK